MSHQYRHGQHPNSRANLRPVSPLEPDTLSHTARVTGNPSAVKWWALLTARQRGALVARLYSEAQP